MYLIDYHIHSLYSSDSRSDLGDICRNAYLKGLKEIADTGIELRLESRWPCLYSPI